MKIKWIVFGNRLITFKIAGPLGVQNLTASLPSPGTEGVTSVSDLVLTWSPEPQSQQDSYRITYQEVLDGNPPSASDVTGLNAADASVIVTSSTQFVLTSLLPGRNYSLSVIALSNGMESDDVVVYQATRESLDSIHQHQITDCMHMSAQKLVSFLHKEFDANSKFNFTVSIFC